MKSVTPLSLSAAAILGLGISMSSANHRAIGQYIQLWPDAGAIGSMLPDRTTLRASTGEELTGTVAHVIAYAADGIARGASASDHKPKQMLIFLTTSGRYVVHFLDLPEGHGWYGPF